MCTHKPSLRGLIPESWGNGAGAAGSSKSGGPNQVSQHTWILCAHIDVLMEKLCKHKAYGKQNEPKPMRGKDFPPQSQCLLATLFTVISFMSFFFSSGLNCSVRHVWQHVGQTPSDEVSGQIKAKSKHIKSIINTGSQYSWSVQNTSSDQTSYQDNVSEWLTIAGECH